MTAIEPSRRAFLGGVASAGLLLVVGLPGAEAAADGGDGFAPNAFIRLDRQGRVVLTIPQAEMGQGVYTSLSQLLADELDVSLAQVAVAAAPPDDLLYGGPKSHRQSTGGSTSIINFYTALRQAGANGRAMLVAAGATAWGVDPASCRTADGVVFHDKSGRKIAYGALAERASAVRLAGDAPLKRPEQFRLIGKSVRRLDTPGKTNGTAQFGMDVQLPGMTVATLAQAPVLGGRVVRVDDTRAKQVPGVRQVVVLPDVVAVVGDHSWAAIKGLRALDIQWDDGPHAHVGTDTVWAEMRQASAHAGDGAVAGTTGKYVETLGRGARVEAAYELPFLAHAAMEPLVVTVHCTPDKVELWTATQVQTRARAAAAKVAGLKPEQVVLHNYMLGGGFGRRLDVDMIEVAVRIAQKVTGPVKVMWTREEDMRHDVYRPVYRNVMAATIDDGHVTGWHHRIVAASIVARMSGKPLQDGLDRSHAEGATELLYDIPDRRVDYIRVEPLAVNVGWWRGVGPNNTFFAVESFIDELAIKAGKDPVAFRLAMLDGTPRAKAALTLAADKAGWSRPLAPRTGRGVSVQYAFGSYMATICEVEVDHDGNVRVRRFVSAVDAGRIVNPDTVVAQVQGGLIFGLTAALYGDITIKNGRVEQSNYNNYRMLRINQAPEIEVHIIPSDENPGGIGEPGTTASTPAIANAIAAATGVRVRRMPINRDELASPKRT